MKPRFHSRLSILTIATAFLSMGAAHGQTYYFDVNGATSGSGIVDTGVYGWTGSNWADDNTGTATTSTKNWSSGNSVVFASTADVGANSYTVTLPGGYTQTWVKDLTVNSGNLSISNGSNANFVLGANSTWTVATGSSLSINSSGNSGWRAVNMNGSSLVLDTQGTATATIAGLNNTSGSVTKNGTGTLTLTDEGNYSGGTTINAGTLTATRGSIGSGAVVINNSATLYVADQWVFSGTNDHGVSFPNENPTSLTIYTGGTLQLDNTNGFANGATNLYLNGGLVTGGPNNFRGDLYLYNGNEQITAGGTTTSTIASVIGVTGNNNTITVDSGSTLNITGVVKNSDWNNNGGGSGGLIKAGAGTLTLSGANSYTGSTAINGGTLKLQGTAFSTKDRAYTIATGAVLNLDGSTSVASGTTTINGTGTLRISGSGLSNGTGGGRFITMALGGGALIEIQSGTGIYNGGWQSMTWSSNSAGMQVDGNINLADGNNVFVDALTGAGTVTGNNPRTLTVGVNGGSGTFSGAIGESILFTKNGSGTQILTGPNSYTGNTTVAGGTLSLGTGTTNTSLANGADVIVDPSCTLNLNYSGTDVIDELWLGGVQKSPGVYGAGTYSGATITGTGTLTVTNGPPADPFANWMSTNYPAIVFPNNLPGADPENDGIPNLLEYVLQGGDPSLSTTGTLPTLNASGANFVFTYYRRAAATGTAQTFEYGTTLSGWTPVAIPGGAGVTVNDQGGGIDKVEITVAKGINTKLFGRLQVVK